MPTKKASLKAQASKNKEVKVKQVVSKKTKSTDLSLKDIQAEIITLLALWDLGGKQTEVKKSDLTKRVSRTNEKPGESQRIFEQLEQVGAIGIFTKNRVVNISLTDKGLQMLGEGLKNPDFEFDGQQVGSAVANALVKWIRHIGGANASSAGVSLTEVQVFNQNQAEITSYEQFQQVVLEVYKKLNQNYNFDNLVPIFRIRREIGDYLTREKFNEWLLEMQANDILQLQGGSLPDNDPTKIEDSITTPVNGLRCYAKLLNS